MSVAELLEAAIADIRRQGYDPAVLADESCVRTFADSCGSDPGTGIWSPTRSPPLRPMSSWPGGSCGRI